MHILVIHDRVPQAERSGADARLMQLLLELTRQNHTLTLVARAPSIDSDSSEALVALGIRVFAGDAERLRYLGIDSVSGWTLDDVLLNSGFDLALLTNWFWNSISITEHYIGSIRALSPTTKIGVITDDVHHVRAYRHAALTGSFADWERAANYHEREIEIYNASDIVIAITPADQQILQQVAKCQIIQVVPMAVEQLSTAIPGFHEREGVFFLGDFTNRATVDGLEWFLTDIWPLVTRGIDGVQLWLAGNEAPITRVSALSDVINLGHLETLTETLKKSRLFVSPIRFGTGLSTKTLYALGAGTPVVATPTCSSGLELSDFVHARIASDPEAFAQAVRDIYTDASLWTHLSSNGFHYVHKKFSVAEQRNKLIRVLEDVADLQSKTSVPTWSSLAVEERYPEVLTYRPAATRPVLRCIAYLNYADYFLRKGDPLRALAQARHIFSFVGETIRADDAQLTDIAKLMCKCYAELGDSIGVNRCRSLTALL